MKRIQAIIENQQKKNKEMFNIFNRILGRNPTLEEISRYNRIGADFLFTVVESIKNEELATSELGKLIKEASEVKKHFGVSLVSTYNVPCGIATYTENLFKELKKILPCNVISDDSRNREIPATEEGVIKGWSMTHDNSLMNILKVATTCGNKIIHFQHEYGLFRNDQIFSNLLKTLRQCGFIVIVTHHTLITDRPFHVFSSIFAPANVNIVHSEMATHYFYDHKIYNTTAIHHGTTYPIICNETDCQNCVNQYFPENQKVDFSKDFFISTPGFISKNKMQKETVIGVSKAIVKNNNIKYLLIGSTGRRPPDNDYFLSLKEYESPNLRIVQKFITEEEMAKILTVSKISIMNYEQTNYSISGMSHLLLTYGVPSISSSSRILEDLTEDISLKVHSDNTDMIASAIIQFINDPALLNKMKENIRIKAEKTYWDKIAAIHLNLYKKLEEAYNEG